MMHLCLTPAVLLLCTTAALGADPSTSTMQASPSNPLATETMERLSAIVDRPLFSPSRHGASIPQMSRDPEPRTSPTPPPNLVVSGVVMDGASAHVVVQVGPEKKTIRAQVGDEIGGWTVSGIVGRKLILSLDGRFATFTLFNREADQRILSDGPISPYAPQFPQQQNPTSAGNKAKD
ncbi:hypothetical protein [Bradyrhizobium erythrophlei]|uniref:General secretion pathway protein N n=1 Tax=Bradyrhizobium erythrophlei TaxID=1437360 RepID=A0A1M7UY43_9BRAD|nr:hypothetical protein [Bradyrhizobium erythrophlei]SHN87836.1 hypothetical protein SAMN05444170_7397 [Bradyrhizobium erythrophlei]